MRALTVAVLIAILTAFTPAHLMEQDDLGTVDFEISCSPEVEADFEKGLALLHHMMYVQAGAAFQSIADDEPSCAMAYWGVAMTQLRPLWAPPTDDEFERGREAVKQAKALDVPDEREAQYIEVIAAYYDAGVGNGHRAGIQAWETAQEALHETYPDDVDAAAFYALAHLATAPSDDKTYAHQQRAGALLEEYFDEASEHPGLFHYLIHAYDNPVLAEEAVEVAHGYDDLAPDVPHALHMPSHIFVRLGMWPEVVDWNRRSAEAALRQSPDAYTSLHHVHALDYMVYGYLQRGQDQKAKDALQEILDVTHYQPHPASAYGIAAAQARYKLERRRWDEAANLPLRIHDAYPWDDFPEHESITYWARGLGAAKTGDLDAARSAVEMLEDLHQRTLDKGEDYWATLVDVRSTTVFAWIAYAEGDVDRALRLMEEAADLEDTVDKHPITPSEVLPARELLGDMLLALDRPEDALEAYRATLETSPNRFNNLYGIGRAAEKAGKPEVAKEAYTKLIELSGDTGRDQLSRAKSFLSEH